MKPALHVQGMHGLGDSLHQRAVMRQLMQRYSVTLETSWPSVYDDLIAAGLKVTRRPIGLRTQTKNANRGSEAAKFTARDPRVPVGAGMRISYGGGAVMKTESKTVLEAMCHATGTDYLTADYRLDIPDAWTQALFATLGALPARAADNPWLVYRPLVARPEWRGSIIRNANPDAYAKLFQLIRDTFFVVSVADLEPGREWLAPGPQLRRPDITLHAGELTFETLAALFKHSDLVYTSSGFAAILGPAVGTSTISIVGGYESIGCHSSGARFAPYLAIGPQAECGCWTSQCRQVCDKAIDVNTGADRMRAFMAEIGISISECETPFEEMFVLDSATAPPALPGAQRGTVLQQRRALLASMNRGLRA